MGLYCGITHEWCNYPDKQWLILAVATLSKGTDEIFKPDYVPIAEHIRRQQHKDQIYVHNDDGLLDVPKALIPKKKGRAIQMVTLSKADKLKAKIVLAEALEAKAAERSNKLK